MGVIDSLRRGIIAPPGKRKRTKKEAKERIRSIPAPAPFLVPPIARPVVRAVPLLAEALVDIDPLGLTASAPTQTLPDPIVRGGDSPGNIARAFKESANIRKERQTMNTEDTIRAMINDPSIVLTPEDVAIINDPSVMMDMNNQLQRFAAAFSQMGTLPGKKKKKVSKYQKELGRQLKLLKKKHPRKKVTALMKQAHRLTRKALSK